jgi:hypothetical protein
MKHLLVISAFIACSFSTKVSSENTNVYICNSSSSEVYHVDLECSGLKVCKHEILKVTQYEAVYDFGRRECKKCSSQ